MKFNAYHFCGDKLRDGRDIPADGVKLIHEGEIEWCESGLYASDKPWQALKYAPGHTLCRVWCDKIERRDTDKFVCRERTIVARIDAEKLLWDFARSCARDVLDLWDAPDVVREYLVTGDEDLRAAARAAAWAAAWAAARDAARDAAWAAAWAAARDAQEKKQRARFTRMVNKAFEDQS